MHHTKRLAPEHRAAHRPRRRGVALLLVLIALAMAAVLAVGYLSTAQTASATATQFTNHGQAKAIAESMMQLTLRRVQEDDAWRDAIGATDGEWFLDQALGGGSVNVYVYDGRDLDGDGLITPPTEGDGDIADDNTDVFTLVVEATYDGVTHRARAVITPAIAPQGEIVTVLLIVPNEDSLSSQDLQRKTTLEDWGYTVVPFSADANAADYATALADADVVYISEETNSANVDASLFNAAVGIVNEENHLDQQTGVASLTGSETSAHAITVTNTSHYITQTLSAGSIDIASTNTDLCQTGGTVAAGADALASIGGRPSLVAIEYGSLNSANVASPGRRVKLPWGGNGFDINRLNDDGLTLMRRAVEWTSVHTGDTQQGGLTAQWYHESGSVNAFASFDWDNPDDTTTVANIDFANRTAEPFAEGQPTDRFALKLTGTIRFTQAGEHRFRLGSDDGSELVINGTTIVDQDVLQSFKKRTGSITLPAGDYAITIRFFENGGQQGLTLEWQQPGDATWTTVPPEAFVDPDAVDEPTLIALYEFNEVVDEPVLLSHWKLDEAPPVSFEGISVGDEIDLKTGCFIDSYNAGSGPYGGANVSANAVVTTNAELGSGIHGGGGVRGDAYAGPLAVLPDLISVTVTGSVANLPAILNLDPPDFPQALPSNIGTLQINSHTLINTDLHVNDFRVKNGKVVTIRGNIVIAAEGDVTLDNGAAIALDPGATLTVYTRGDVRLKNGSIMPASTRETGRASLYAVGPASSVILDNSSTFVGTVRAAGDVTLKNGSAVYGLLSAGQNLTVMNFAAIHQDRSLGTDAAMAPAANEVAAGPQGTYVDALGGHAAPATAGAATAAEFDSADDAHVRIPHDDSLLIDQGTIAFWFLTQDKNREEGLFSKDASGYGEGGHLTIRTHGRRVKARLQSTNHSYEIASDFTVEDDAWHHVAFAFGDGGMKLYIDGVLQSDTDEYTGGLGTSSGGEGNTEPLALGMNAWGSSAGTVTPGNHHLTGAIDDVRVYDRPLTADQVAELIAYREPGPTPSPVLDTSDYEDPLDLVTPDPGKVTWLPGGGLRVDSDTIIYSNSPSTKIYDAITATGEFTMEVTFAYTSTSVSWGRIATYSANENTHNFSFLQDRARHRSMFRTSNTDAYGGPAMQGTTNMTAGVTDHALITWNGETFRIFRNGNLETEEPRTGDLSAWNNALDFTLANVRSGTRPWRGTLYRVAIYDRAINEMQARNVFNGDPPGAPDAAEERSFSIRWDEFD